MNWKTITVKHPNKCIQCGILINEGETALWLERLGIKHQECDIDSTKDESKIIIIDEEVQRLMGNPELTRNDLIE